MTGWMKARSNCTIGDIFDAIAKEIGNDIGRFNSLGPERRGKRLYKAGQEQDGNLENHLVERITDGHGAMCLVPVEDCKDDYPSVRCTDSEIIASRQDRVPIKIIPRWNEESLNCDLYVGDVSCPLEAVSRKILREFPYDDPPRAAQLRLWDISSIRLMKQGITNSSEMAQLLCYSDITSIYRAFRRWTGVSLA